MLEKFRSVQERARRVQRLNLDGEDISAAGIADLRVGDDSLEPKSSVRVPATGATPMMSVKEASSAAPLKKSGLGRQFGRLGGAVSGKNRRS